MIRVAQVSDAEGIARVQVDTWRATYAGLMPDEVLAGLSYESGAQRWQNTLTTYREQNVAVVAENNAGEVIGFVLGGQARDGYTEYGGEIFALYVLPKAQGQASDGSLCRPLLPNCWNGG